MSTELLARLTLDWRFDVVFGTAALVLAALYLLGLRRLRGRGTPWPAWRTTAWFAGCVVILLATSSGIGRHASAIFGVHVLSQLLLAVLAPILLVLGGPVVLMLRTLRSRRRLLSLLRAPVFRLLTRPAVTFTLLVAPLYLLYFSSVFDTLAPYSWAHLAMNVYFLVAGYLFFWPVIGVDPAPVRLPPVGRLGIMFALLPAFGFLAVVLTNMSTPLGADYYGALNLPWQNDLMANQRLGGTAVWAVGELPALVVLIATAIQWARSDERDATHADRKPTGEANLAEYNAMLNRLHNR